MLAVSSSSTTYAISEPFLVGRVLLEATMPATVTGIPSANRVGPSSPFTSSNTSFSVTAPLSRAVAR